MEPSDKKADADTLLPEQAAYEHNGRHVERAEFYAIACDPRRSVAVEACAGAGKTWMLVSRMLRALLEGCAPHEILAITFTKKAAGEMRQRLQEWLQQFAQLPPEALTQELIHRGLSPQAASNQREQLRNLYRHVLESARPVQIRTFHSWFAALLGTAPLAVLQEHGLPARFELLEDDAQAVREVWQPFLQAVAADAPLRADYEAVVATHGRTQTHKALAAVLAKRVEFDLADAAGVVAASVPHFAQMFAPLQAFEEPAQALAQPEALARWQAWAKALAAERNKTPQKAAAAIVDALARADLDARLDRLRKALFVASADRLSNHLQKFAAAQEAEAELQMLLRARRQHAAWQHQQRMARLTRCLLAQFAALKRARGWVDMNDVERMAQRMLADPVLSGWVQERLDARVRHLLIDEFQDTNPLQWQALHAWLSGYAGAGGGAAPSVFIVGDPKQSIYRFRRAEPQVFVAAQDFVRTALGGDLLSCDHTRRNARRVLAAVNQVMQAAQVQGHTSGFRAHSTESAEAGRLLRLPPVTASADAQASDMQDGAKAGEGAEGGMKSGGESGGASSGASAVEGQDALPASAQAPAQSAAETQPLPQPEWRDSLTTPRHTPEESLRLRECAQAAQWVAAQIESGTPPREVLVLAQKRDRLGFMEEALRALHIPCVQPEKADLYDAPAVQDMVALLDALVSPGNDLALARALKSPLFGLADEQLVRLACLRRAPAQAASSWFELLQKEELLTQDGRTLGPILMQYQGWVRSLPPHDALHAIYTHGDVLARFAAAAPAAQRQLVQAQLRALLGAALQHAGGRYLTPYAFVRAMKKGGVPAPLRADLQAVRLLTVHGAKGLEADCVLLLDCDAPAQKAESMGVLIDWPGAQAAPRRLVFLAKESEPPPSAEETLAAELQARLREERNKLYVAMTRARRCLVLSATQTSRSASDSWWKQIGAAAAGLLEDVAPEALHAPAAASASVAPASDAAVSATAVSATAVSATAAAPDSAQHQDTAAEQASPEAPAGTAESQTFVLPELPAFAQAESAYGTMGAGAVPSPVSSVVLDPPQGPDSTAANDPAARLGNAMHELLEQAGVASALQLQTWRRAGWPAVRLALLAQTHGLSLAAATQAAALAQRILAGGGAWAWEPDGIAQAANEVPLHYQGQSLRLDRLVYRHSPAELAGWWVLDYKSAAAPEQQADLLSQLKHYREAVKALVAPAGDVSVYAAFLSGDGRVVVV
ncbi:UvrD-helicase domain-containing protein [Extensimonas perlucida]|uniref:UvrD-helicase domain-containing protein n=1 Tax=Extensimonas perlucida TaxID=2590786 RepID=UPI001FE51187|nr:UvrD-helicase domain-containing protein [Extensimonas perlucida]